MSTDSKLQELASDLRAIRSKLPAATSENAYAQQARALQGMTREPPNGDSSESFVGSVDSSANTRR
jgi:hypothetical protein